MHLDFKGSIVATEATILSRLLLELWIFRLIFWIPGVSFLPLSEGLNSPGEGFLFLAHQNFAANSDFILLVRME